ncbi:MAG: neutral zinc metallopeptidase [Cocleimonas sp.]|nr:neutral zinc metallopeptidase [Cocleimonas sp.]
MKWRDRKQSTNVDDRRSSSGRGGGRGLPSIGTLMFLWPLLKPLLKSKLGLAVVGVGAAAYFFMPSIIGMGGSSKPADTKADDVQAAFIKTVHADTEKVWSNIFAQAGERYPAPELVLYRGGTDSRCGPAKAGMGPFYCPSDQKIYVDLVFFRDLKNKHGAGGDFAQAYVLAHEIGHHIQNKEGTLDKVQRAKQRVSGSDDNKLQVMVELQADCYAGVWANQAQKQFKMLEAGDIEEALTAAASIGDDRLQKQAQGFSIPHTFTHGSSKQRVEWFAKGLKSGMMRDCNTFK